MPGRILVDMSAAAITARLNKAGQLYELSRLLKSAKRIDAPTTRDLAPSNGSIVAESPTVER